MEGTAGGLTVASECPCLSANTAETLLSIYEAQEIVSGQPQTEVETEHVFHAGMYARTVRLPAGVVAVGTLIKVPTLVIVHGDVDLLAGGGLIEVRGYAVLRGDVGRKAFLATRSAVEMTMLFATQARTVDEAEREFTDEYEQLVTRKGQVCRD